jgi:parvulin-like peptidyl-prolyl isomerase
MTKTFGRLAVLALCAALMAPALQAEILEQIVVKVNGDIITKTEFEQRQVLALRARNLQFSEGQTDQLKQAIAEITPQLIVDAVDELLLLQRGRELGYSLSDQQFEQVVQQIRKENKLDTDAAFEAALRQEGMTMADLRRNLEKQMIISRVQGKEVMQKVGITEEEARKYHAEHRNEFTKPATVTLREILINVPAAEQGVNVSADETVREKIAEIRRRVLAGEAFEKLAADTSDSPSRANGGLIGPLNVNELSEPLQKLLASMKPGDVSEPIRTPKGYQLLKLEATTPEQVLTPEQARDQIADKLYEAKRREELKKYLARLRREAIIEWKNEEIRKAYESVVPPGPATEPAPAAERAPTP